MRKSHKCIRPSLKNQSLWILSLTPNQKPPQVLSAFSDKAARQKTISTRWQKNTGFARNFSVLRRPKALALAIVLVDVRVLAFAKKNHFFIISVLPALFLIPALAHGHFPVRLSLKKLTI